MARLSIPLLLSSLFAARCSAQGQAIPLAAITAAPGAACPCYIVADVRGIVFGTETVTQTDVVVASTAVGRNATAIVTSTIFAPDMPFTLGPSGLLTAPPSGATVFNYNGGVVTFAGLTLSGPGAIDVFTAYTYFTGSADASGTCIMSSEPPVTLPTPFTTSVPLDADLGAAAIAAENAFGAFIALPTCSGGGANFGQQTQVPAVVVTVTSATVGPAFVPTLVPVTIGGVTLTTTTSVPLVGTTTTSSGGISLTPTTTITVASTSTATVLTTVASLSETYIPPNYTIGAPTSSIKYAEGARGSNGQLLSWVGGVAAIALGAVAL